jgi:hypothetical protein
MRMTLPLAAAVLSLLQGCAVSGMQTYQGVYAVGYETQAFWSQEGDGPWWVDGRFGADQRLEEGVRSANAGFPWGSVRVEVRGALSPAGSWGHMGAYDRRLTVYEVISVEPLPADGARG